LHKPIRAGGCVVLFALAGGCLNLNTGSLLSVGTPFVVQGTMTVANGGCLVWEGNNGESFYLYQDPLLDNNLFDQINAPGVTSRLVIVTRSDLSAPAKRTRSLRCRRSSRLSSRGIVCG
jgi:hypothetical protein